MIKKKIAIFASGSGTNAEQIIIFFKSHPLAEVALVLTNKPDAFVLERARRFGVPIHVFDRTTFHETTGVLQVLQENDVSLVVLAGFLWLIPEYLISAFPGRIINIHPALLPAYGGKGMYGSHVHEAVLRSGDKKSGITIHFVNEKYDDGAIIFQEKCEVLPDDTPESLAGRIHRLEHRHYPEVIEELVKGMG